MSDMFDIPLFLLLFSFICSPTGFLLHPSLLLLWCRGQASKRDLTPSLRRFITRLNAAGGP